MDKKDEKNSVEHAEEVTEGSAEQSEHIESKAEIVDQRDQKIAELESQARRFLADYQNLQRRTQEQKAEWIRSANRDLLLKILPVLDTLMLAQKHTQDKGIELSINQFLQVLTQEGLTRIKTIGEEFTPHLMEAVGTTDGEEGKVVEEVRAGFMLYNQVLRSAQVIVGKEEQK
jgi:molecular chaperone GrpE